VGYKSQAIQYFNWNARLLPEETLGKNGSDLVFAFEPNQGSGTYEIVASSVVEEAFVLPAVRADLWGVSSPEWSQLSGHFPTRGINGTRRTFFPEEGSFTHDQKMFSWNVTSGISPLNTDGSGPSRCPGGDMSGNRFFLERTGESWGRFESRTWKPAKFRRVIG
jgi:hypothetical protein